MNQCFADLVTVLSLLLNAPADAASDKYEVYQDFQQQVYECTFEKKKADIDILTAQEKVCIYHPKMCKESSGLVIQPPIKEDPRKQAKSGMPEGNPSSNEGDGTVVVNSGGGDFPDPDADKKAAEMRAQKIQEFCTEFSDICVEGAIQP